MTAGSILLERVVIALHSAENRRAAGRTRARTALSGTNGTGSST